MPDKKKRQTPIETRYKTFISKMEPIKDFRGRELETRELQEVFSKKRMKNCIILGEAGVGKTALVRHVAQVLKSEARFFELNIGSLMCNTEFRGQMETKLVNMMKAVREENTKSDRPYVFFIDEFHMVVGAGMSKDDRVDVSNLMKQYLTEDTFIVWGATTLKEYQESVRTNPAFARRFTVIPLRELADDVVLGILKDFSEDTVDSDLLGYILEKSKTIPTGHQPDVSIEMLDRCMARREVSSDPITKEMVDSISESMRAFFNWESQNA